MAPMYLLMFLVMAGPRYGVVDLAGLDMSTSADIKSHRQVAWWVELDQSLLVLWEGDSATLPVGVRLLEVTPQPEKLVFLRGPKPKSGEVAGTVLASGGRFSVIQQENTAKPLLLETDRFAHGHSDGGHAHHQILPFKANFRLAVWQRSTGTFKRACGTVQGLVDLVDADRWYNDTAFLAGFNRNTHQPGNIQARDWLVAQFEGLGLSVETPSFQVSGTETFNVIATLPGHTRPDEWYVVGAHFDSTSQNTTQAAPGAEDNGSGTAAVLEMARIFSTFRPEATVLFICYSGEEQGLWGSRDHVNDLIAAGDSDRLQFALIMDMVGYTRDADLDCLLETFSQHQSYMNDMIAAAQQYTSLRMVTSFNPFGSDHMPYLNEGFPAVLAIENDWDEYPHYHRTTDEADHVDRDMGSEIIRMNVAALAQWAGAVGPITLSEELPAWHTLAFPDGVSDVNDNRIVDVQDLVASACVE